MKEVFTAMKSRPVSLLILLPAMLTCLAPCQGALPVDTTGLVKHIDAGSLTGLVDGDPVNVWPDLAGYDDMVPYASVPTYRTGVINGLPVVRFDGTGGMTATTSATHFGGNQAHTVFAVAIATEYTGSGVAMWQIGRTGSGLYAAFTLESGGTYIGCRMGNGWNRLTPGTPHSLNVPNLYVISYPGTKYSDYALDIDGVAATNAANNPNNTMAMDDSTIRVGNRDNSSTSFNGDVAELLVFNRALSDDERRILGYYLAAKYGLATAYPIPPLDSPFYVFNDSPADGAVGIDSAQDIVLKWIPGYVPNRVVEYRVYLSDDPSIGVPDAGQIPLAVAGTDDPNVVISANTLEEGTDYYWRVDSYGDPSTGLGDPNNTAGDMWKFKTSRVKPIIDVPPSYTMGWRDEVVTISLQARSGEYDDQGAMTYDWYDNGGSLGAPSLPTLQYTVGTEDQDIYCIVSNVNGSRTSPTARLHVKKWVGWWKCDEGSGDVLYDSSPEYHRVIATPNDAVRAGAGTDDVWTAEGKIDGALDLDGDGEYFTTSNNASALGIGGNDPRSFTSWVYTRAFNNGAIYDLGDHSGPAHNFCLRTRDNANTERWRIQYYGADRDFWTWRQDGNKDQDNQFNFASANAWVHFAHIHDGSNTKIYANGVLIIDWPRPLDTFDNHPLMIGVYNHSNEFDGIIDDIRAFNYALSREEVIDIYAEGEPDASFCDGSNPADINNDCAVNILDLAEVAEAYLSSGILSN